MKKIIITACLFGILAITPFSVGFLAKNYYTEVMTHQSSKQITFSNTNYNNSWLHSTVTTQIDINDPEVVRYYQEQYNTTLPLQISIEHHVQHGPLLFNENGISFGLISSQDIVTFSKSSAPELHTLTESGTIATATSTVSFNGEYHNSIQIAAIKHQGQDIQLNIESSTVELSTSKNTQNIEAQFNIPKITAKIDVDGYLQVQGLNIHIKQWKKEGTPLGEWVFKTDTSKIQKGGITLFEGEASSNLVSLTNQDAQPSLLDFVYQAEFKKIQIEGTHYEQGKLHLKIANIPMQTVSNIAAANSQQEAMDNITQILSEGLLVDMSELNFTTEQGDVIGKLHAQLPKLSAQQTSDMAYIRANIEVKLNVSAPRDFIDTTPLVTQIPLFLMMGIIKEQDGIYSIHANLKDNKLQINGKDMPF